MVPHHFHLIWQGPRFPFPYRLAVESILLTNPGARISLHYSDPPNNAHWLDLADEPRVEMRPLDVEALFDRAGEVGKSVRESYHSIARDYPAGRSNLLRYLILLAEGGIYVDFDTLTVRDLKPLVQRHKGFLGEEWVFRCDDDRVQGRFKAEFLPLGALFGVSYAVAQMNARLLGNAAPVRSANSLLQRLWGARKLNNAVLACEKGSPFFAKALNLVSQTDPSVRFALGPILMNRTWDETAGAEMSRLSPDFFYTIPPSQTIRFFKGRAPGLSDKVHILHWCSSNHRKLITGLNPSVLSRPRRGEPLFHLLARRILAGEQPLQEQTEA